METTVGFYLTRRNTPTVLILDSVASYFLSHAAGESMDGTDGSVGQVSSANVGRNLGAA